MCNVGVVFVVGNYDPDHGVADSDASRRGFESDHQGEAAEGAGIEEVDKGQFLFSPRAWQEQAIIVNMK